MGCFFKSLQSFIYGAVTAKYDQAQRGFCFGRKLSGDLDGVTGFFLYKVAVSDFPGLKNRFDLALPYLQTLAGA